MTTDTSAGLASGTPELRRLNLAMVFAALAAFGMLYSTQALLPAIGAGFGVGPTAASLTISAATGAIALGMLPLSSMAESVGRVPVMRAGSSGSGRLPQATAKYANRTCRRRRRSPTERMSG